MVPFVGGAAAFEDGAARRDRPTRPKLMTCARAGSFLKKDVCMKQRLFFGFRSVCISKINSMLSSTLKRQNPKLFFSVGVKKLRPVHCQYLVSASSTLTLWVDFFSTIFKWAACPKGLIHQHVSRSNSSLHTVTKDSRFSGGTSKCMMSPTRSTCKYRFTHAGEPKVKIV